MACGKFTVLTIFLVIFAFFTANGYKDVIVLNENNWTDMLKDEWMVEL